MILADTIALLADWRHLVFGPLLFFAAVFLILLVLVQRGRGGGLTGALGGMGGQSAFGTKAGDVFTRVTMVTAFIWILLCMAAIKVLSPPPRTALPGANFGGPQLPGEEQPGEGTDEGVTPSGGGENAGTAPPEQPGTMGQPAESSPPATEKSDSTSAGDAGGSGSDQPPAGGTGSQKPPAETP